LRDEVSDSPGIALRVWTTVDDRQLGDYMIALLESGDRVVTGIGTVVGADRQNCFAGREETIPPSIRLRFRHALFTSNQCRHVFPRQERCTALRRSCTGNSQRIPIDFNSSESRASVAQKP
jgi:hypothetical protein